MKYFKQISMFPNDKNINSFGGALNAGKRKSARPIATNSPMHIVIKSDRLIFNKNLKQHRLNLQKVSSACGMKLLEYKFNGNHIHLVARFFQRESYFRFIRIFTGLVAICAGLKRVFPHRPFTRIIKWGKDFRNVKLYLQLNEFESDGIKRVDGRRVLAEMALDPPD